MTLKPTCAGPHPYRTPCSHFATNGGGKQPAHHHWEVQRRWCDEGARQGDSGRWHFGLMVRHSPPLDEALARIRTSRPTEPVAWIAGRGPRG